ncbi:MAG TPA: protein kinase [Bryobacteraceae bacterium]|nr:protein kinase [Bryobacteraceae bacterium]
MSIAAGTRLGPYEILAPIGAGGMGEVWKASDTRLDRIVAIKVSQENFSERFEREARAIAALNHPNICQLYDVGPNYLVMEYVEGAPLVSKERGPLGTEEALRYAAQICEALDHAHRRGITHRDLKPANILLTKQGIKLLDFGLAKLRPSPLRETDATLTQALTKPLTRDGQILGTLQYMSPEQLQGKEADARSDLFSFGCVLYEMLTAKRAFDGQSAASVIAAILERPAPSVSSVAPAALDRVLQRCLAKDPDQRFQNALDLKAALEWSMQSSSESAAAPAPSLSRLGRFTVVAAAVLAVGFVIAGVGWYRATRPPELKPLVRLDVDLGPDVSLGAGPNVILSPDGSRLVFVSQGKLFTRKMDQPRATELAGTQGATSPFFSPDGQWVAFFSQNKLRKISVEGGAAIALCDSGASFTGGSWGEDRNIVVALSPGGPLSRIPAAGGAPSPITELDRTRGEATHRWPQVLPGAKAVLFAAHTTIGGGFDEANIDVMTLADTLKNTRRKTLVRGGLYPRYIPSGYLLYVNRGTLFAVPFDLDRLELRGAPVPLLEQVAYSAQFGYAQLDFSRNGTLIYRGGEGGGLVTMQWLDGAGKTQPLLAKPDSYLYPKLSPDGRRLAIFTAEGSNGNISVYEPQRDTMTRVTFEAGGVSWPLWTPDGQYIVFSGTTGMYWTRADGAGKAQPLTKTKSTGQFSGSMTADGKRLAYEELGSGTLFDLWTVPLESDSAGLRAGKPELFLQTPFDEQNPSFSPDGRWLAYDSDESGTLQTYVRAFPDKGGKWQVSSGGGTFPKWSRDERELFFRNLDDQIMVASYSVTGDSFVADKPRLWSEKRLANQGTSGTYDVAPDGKRIAALMPAEGQEGQKAQNHVIFLENFFDELRRKVPAGK